MKFELPVFTLAKINSANMRSEKRGPDELEPADGPRYKALGNSWAVNCARWIGERIASVDCIAAGDAA